MKNAYSIKIFLPEGDPEGLRIIEKSNWNGRGLVSPRSKFSSSRDRDELDSTGVYVLIGPDTESGLERIYVGEGDPAKPRLDSHHASKDFWQTFVLFTSKDRSLNKAHIQYLESRLIAIAKDANRSVLDNNTAPTQPSMSESDKAEAEGFLQEMLLCFPVLGISLFNKPTTAAHQGLKLYLKAKNETIAEGYEASEGFVVLPKSRANLQEQPSIHGYLHEIRESLVNRGLFESKNGFYVLKEAYAFNSPSTAAGVMLGRSANGRTEWKDAKGITLKETQEKQSGDVAKGQHA
jgi:Domain of unknown function (DUF4357)